LIINDLFLKRGGQMVLQDITMRIDGSGLYGIIGPNGGGKSSLFNVILGLTAPTQGSVSVFGLPPAKVSARLGFVPQVAKFDRGFPITLHDMVATALLGPGLRARRPADGATRVLDAMDATGIRDLADRPLSALSGGELQRGLIARALATSPDMLLMDEPTASVDQAHGTSLFRLMCDIAQERPVLVISHDLAQIAAHSTQVYCLNRQLWPAPEGADAGQLANEIFGGPVHCSRKETAA
jgi:zinc transport system ATP-binding protein